MKIVAGYAMPELADIEDINARARERAKEISGGLLAEAKNVTGIRIKTAALHFANEHILWKYQSERSLFASRFANELDAILRVAGLRPEQGGDE